MGVLGFEPTEVTGVVIDPYAGGGKANAKMRGTTKGVTMRGLVYPYEGDATYGETVTYLWTPPTNEQIRERADAIRRARGWKCG